MNTFFFYYVYKLNKLTRYQQRFVADTISSLKHDYINSSSETGNYISLLLLKKIIDDPIRGREIEDFYGIFFYPFFFYIY